ncbi:MAG: FHA domain-containing protein [Planctomycetaceae bacterium]|nr:FHA domain-containing protein [Planctomycetaceae bacterium]
MLVQGALRMLVVWEGGSVALNAKPGRNVTLGRDPECDVVVPVPTVSRQHLRLRHDRGVWTVTDCGSTVGTRRQGRVIPPQQAVPLIDGDQLDLGAGVMAAVEIEHFMSTGSVEIVDDAGVVGEVKAIPQASTDGLLAHVLSASRAIGQAANENDIWANAARALAEASGLGVVSAAVLEVGDPEHIEALSEHGARTHGWSRRGIAAALAKPGHTAVFERGGGGAADRATMMGDSQYVACHAPVVSHGAGALVLCAEGRAALGDGRANFTHFLGIVSELAVQAVVQLRRSRISRYVSPSVASLLARGGQDALEQAPHWMSAACLFLDLQGFSSLVDGEEHALAEVHARVRRVMDSLASAAFAEQGMVVDFTGDGLFAAFGVPAPHEGHVGAAVRAALVMRATAPASRVGLDAGRCLFGPMGARQHAKLGLFGTVVNRASRMEALGKPERLHAGVLCTGSVANDPSAREAGQFLRVGMVQPAGLSEPVEVFEVFASGSVADALAMELQEASRELELARGADALNGLAGRLQARAAVHPRLAWLATQAERLATAPAAWDGVHRPGK